LATQRWPPPKASPDGESNSLVAVAVLAAPTGILPEVVATIAATAPKVTSSRLADTVLMGEFYRCHFSRGPNSLTTIQPLIGAS
jgi:hypothetical protein